VCVPMRVSFGFLLMESCVFRFQLRRVCEFSFKLNMDFIMLTESLLDGNLKVCLLKKLDGFLRRGIVFVRTVVRCSCFVRPQKRF